MLRRRKRRGKRTEAQVTRLQAKNRYNAELRYRQKKLAQTRKIIALRKKRLALIKSFRDHNTQRKNQTLEMDRLERRRRNEHTLREMRETKKRPDTAARSARLKSAQQKPKVRRTLDRSYILALNVRRKKTRNSWSGVKCVEKPDPRKAGVERQKLKGTGSSGAYQPRRWC